MREPAVFSAQRAEYFFPHEGQNLDLQVTLNLCVELQRDRKAFSQGNKLEIFE